MSDAIHSFKTIHNNPFIFTHLFLEFYAGLGKKPKGFLLSYLVLPVVLYPASHNYLCKARSTSSLLILAGKTGNRDRLYGLDERISEYRELTNVSLQYGIDLGIIRFDDELSLESVTVPAKSSCSPEYLKSASRFSLLCEPFDVPTIFRMLGVKRL